MQANRWQQIEDLYHAALAQAPDRRAAFLKQACADNSELQAEVQSLLNLQADSFLEDSPLASAFDVPARSTAGAMIGPYQLQELIGQGGMGEVWLAQQKQPVRRPALKLIKAGMDTREVVARFESERQALALMDHPAIAKVFDAGSTAQGRPYFVMERVVGLPISDYCDTHKFTTGERFQLFIQVCEGVQHVHRKAIIHCDLKPSNILVAEIDGKPAPKIIDFGVAKATAERLIEETLFTQVGVIMGTPAYMSPEQAGSLPEDIDIRSDVYSLGIVLYELLVGAPPFDFRNLQFNRVPLKSREHDASKPSARIRHLGEPATTAASNRRTEPRTLARQLRGDLDAITLKAIEKDRSRRYGSPSELASDLKRYLDNEPVSAHPPSLVYHARKYLRRHRLAMSVAASTVLLFAAFAIAQTYQLHRVTIERDRADRVVALMTAMFNVSGPAPANREAARAILGKASKGIISGLGKDPELQAQLMQAVGKVYFELGLYSEAEVLLRRTVQIRTTMFGEKHRDTLGSMFLLSQVLMYESRSPEVERRKGRGCSPPDSKRTPRDRLARVP